MPKLKGTCSQPAFSLGKLDSDRIAKPLPRAASTSMLSLHAHDDKSWEAISGNMTLHSSLPVKSDSTFNSVCWGEMSGNLPNSGDGGVPRRNSSRSSHSESLGQLSKNKSANSKSPPVSPVKVSARNFLFGTLLGEGAYGRVFHAKLKDSDQQFAVKVC